MRLQSISTKYDSYVKQFYHRNPELKTKPYLEQRAAIMGHSFGAPEMRTKEFARLGYETDHVFANIEPLQKQWALENGCAYNSGSWVLEIARAQVLQFKPEILLMANYSIFKAAYLQELRAACPSLRLILGWCGAPFSDETIFRAYDVILSNIPELVENFIARGHTCYHINHGFDPDILDIIDAQRPKTLDFTFMGSITKSAGHHIQREELILALVKQTDLQIWAEVKTPPAKKLAAIRLSQFGYSLVQAAQRAGVSSQVLLRLPLVNRIARRTKRPDLSGYVDRRIARRAHAPIFGLEMFQKTADSKVVLNTHIDISTHSASNMRLFEATGVGACLLTDWKDNLPELFDPEREVVAYRSIPECLDKLRFLLQNDPERCAIAQAGQKRTLATHTVKQRAEQIDSIIHQELAQHARQP